MNSTISALGPHLISDFVTTISTAGDLPPFLIDTEMPKDSLVALWLEPYGGYGSVGFVRLNGGVGTRPNIRAFSRTELPLRGGKCFSSGESGAAPGRSSISVGGIGLRLHLLQCRKKLQLARLQSESGSVARVRAGLSSLFHLYPLLSSVVGVRGDNDECGNGNNPSYDCNRYIKTIAFNFHPERKDWRYLIAISITRLLSSDIGLYIGLSGPRTNVYPKRFWVSRSESCLWSGRSLSFMRRLT